LQQLNERIRCSLVIGLLGSDGERQRRDSDRHQYDTNRTFHR
jgi:hypothetical protein